MIDIKQQYLELTARDYDMPLNVVKDIYDKHKDNFYEKLEEYIDNRKRNNNGPTNARH